MEFGPAVYTFVPMWIFAPLILIGVIGYFLTPNGTRSRRDPVGSEGGFARA